MVRSGLAVALFTGLTACGPAPRPPERAPEAGRDLRAEARAVLDRLEEGFYAHWGSVERTADFRRLGPEHVPPLREETDAGGPRALGALRVLARLAPQERFSPDARAILYTAAFARENDFTRWGVIAPTGFLPGVYGQELLELGRTSMPYLRPLLRDRRRAPAPREPAGRIQGDRVCDYAWIFLATLYDRPLAYHPEPLARDEQIRQMDLWLDRTKR
jgi:hypothetical protein